MLKKLIIFLQFILLSCNKYLYKVDQKFKGNSKIIEIFKNLKDNNENYKNLFNILGIGELYSFFDEASWKNLKSKKEATKKTLDSFKLFEKFKCGDKINDLDEYGFNIFHYSILYSNDPEIVNILIILGADINLPTSEGKSPIFLFLENKLSYSNLDKFNFKKLNYDLKIIKFEGFLNFFNKIDFSFKYKEITFEHYSKRLHSISSSLKELSEDARLDFYFYGSLISIFEMFKKINIPSDEGVFVNEKDREEIVASLGSHNLNSLQKHLRRFKEEDISKIYLSGKNLLLASIALGFLDGVKTLAPYFKISDPIYINYALKNLNKEIVLYFLKNGVDPNIYNKDGLTPLMLLSSLNIKDKKISIWKELVTILLQNGAKINLPSLKKEFLNFTALHFAIGSHNLKFVEFLIDNGAEINIKRQALRVKSEKSQYEFTYNPLEYSIINQDLEMVKLLVKKGASLSFLNSSQILYDINSNKDLFEFLISSIKSKLNFNKSLIDEKGTLLYNTLTKLKNLPAVAKEFVNIIEKIVKNLEEDVNYEPEIFLGRNCLYAAIHTKSPEIVEILLKNGAKASKRKSYTSLYNEAIFSKSLPILKLLLDYNVEIPSKFNTSISPLNLAVKLGNREMAKLLLEIKGLSYDKEALISDIIFGSEALELSEIYDKDILNKYIGNELIHVITAIGSYNNLRFLIDKGYSPFFKSEKEIKIEGLSYNFFKELQRQKFNNSKTSNLYFIKKVLSALEISIENNDLKAFSIIMESYNEKTLDKNIKEFIENNYIFGESTLLTNVEKEYYGVVNIFLRYKEFEHLLANINYVDEEGKTLLDYLLENRKEEKEDLIVLFREKGALISKDVRESIRIANEEKSLINNIIKENKEEVIKILENDKYEVTKSDKNNITPLIACAIYNCEDILEIILKNLKDINKLSSNIDRVDIENKTALGYAIDFKNYEVAKILIKNGANVNFKYARKNSYIIDLAFDHSKEAEEIIIMLQENGLKLNNKDLKMLVKDKENLNSSILKIFKDQIKSYEDSYFYNSKSLKNLSKIEKILIDKDAMKSFENLSKKNRSKLLFELKKSFEGEKFSDSRDITSYKPKFGEIRIMNNLSSDRIFYIKKGEYLIILDIYLNKRKRLLPNYIYDKAFEKCKFYKSMIVKNKIEELASYAEILILKEIHKDTKIKNFHQEA